ncbi:uncharacterized protein LOC113218244 [Frankliniella occidentalis]|uniref:Uncharacterized protein LOC113218244 n=1 Tax=Frankliniella occidentalis TaxID=133901 RepID=A0A6J1TLB8_FRAOC|nr:uncharacterized protein LOC113218244 [Frankliniella occidentalis]
MGSSVSARRRPASRSSRDGAQQHHADGHGGVENSIGRPEHAEPEEPEESGSRVQLVHLPPELLLRVLGYLDVASLCAAGRALDGHPALAGVLADASLWRGATLALHSATWPAHPPAALHGLRVCSYHWHSAQHALRQLAWLASNLDASSVRRLELVGRNLDRATVRACVRLCAGLRVLSLHDVGVEDGWIKDLATLKNLEALHFDWHSEMSVPQILRLASSCPSLRLIDSGGCPKDCAAGRTRAAAKRALHLLNADLTVA